MELTQEQIEQFDHDGFLLIRGFGDTAMCDEIRTLAAKHLYDKIEPIESEEEYLQRQNDDKTVRRLRQVYDREPLFREWMTNQEIRPVLEQLLGEKAVLLLAHHNSIMTKLPHVSSVTSWHQDKRYWHFEGDNLLSVWLALGDEYIETGLLEFIPGSHKMLFDPEQFDEQSAFREDLPQNLAVNDKRVHFDLKKGDIALFHAKTLHYANKNESDEPKISFVYSLRGVSNKPISGTRSDAREIVL